MSSYQSSFATLVVIFMLWLPNVSAAYGVKRTPSGNDIRWRGHDVTLRIDPALERSLDADQVRSAAAMASDAWRGFGNTPDITIEAGEPSAYDASNRGNGIYLLHRWPFDPKQLAATVSTFGNDGELLGVDVLVSGEQPFALFAENQADVRTDSYDIAAVLTHELGHVLGLDESYEHPEATMFPQIGVGETHQRVLSPDDQQGAMKIYSTPMAVAKVGCAVGDPGATRCRGTLAAVVVGLGGLFGARTRRRHEGRTAVRKALAAARVLRDTAQW